MIFFAMPTCARTTESDPQSDVTIALLLFVLFLIPIIAMTANVFREDIEKCLEAGISNHIGKPLDTDEVLKLVSRYLHL